MNIYARTRFTWSLEFARIRDGSVVVHACNRRGSSLSLLLSRSCTPLFERRGESSVLGILSSCSVSSPRKAEPTGRKFRIAFPEWPRIRPYPWQEMNAKALKEEGWGAHVTKKERMERERNWSFRDYLWKIRSLPRPDSSGWMLGVCLDAGGNVIR